MRYLKTYENHFQSNINSEIEDIFFDMINYDRVKIEVNFKRNGLFVRNKDIINVNFISKPGKGFLPLNHIESFDHLNSFLESEGYVYFADGAVYKTYEDKRKSFERDRNLSLLSINYIKNESNESIVHIGESPMRYDINDIFLELKEEKEFETLITIRQESDNQYKSGKYVNIVNQFCKVEISNENRFEYSDIEEYIERLKDYMAMNNFYCYDFSSYFGPGGEKQPKVQMDLRRQYNRFGNGRWTNKWYSFEITFKSLDPKDLTNEELKSDVYKSAADKLKKLGHIKRPEELMKWHEITKQKEVDALKLATLKDCQQMGIYQLFISYRKGGEDFSYKGDFYINLSFDSYNLDEQYPEWKQGESNLWISFSFGVIPVNDDGKEFCKNVAEPIIGLGGDKITYWLGGFWLNISRSIDIETEELKFVPEGKGYFEEYEGSWNLANRASAMKFKTTLYQIFSGDLIIRETPSVPGGMKEQIIDELCNLRGHDIDEFEDIMNSIKVLNINKLYKD